MPRCRSAWLSHGFCCDRKQTQSGLVVPADLISATIEDKARGTAGTNWPALSFPMIFALDPFWRVSVFEYLHHIQQNEQDWWLEFFISIGWKRVAEFCFFSVAYTFFLCLICFERHQCSSQITLWQCHLKDCPQRFKVFESVLKGSDFKHSPPSLSLSGIDKVEISPIRRHCCELEYGMFGKRY